MERRVTLWVLLETKDYSPPRLISAHASEKTAEKARAAYIDGAEKQFQECYGFSGSYTFYPPTLHVMSVTQVKQRRRKRRKKARCSSCGTTADLVNYWGEKLCRLHAQIRESQS